MEIPRIAQTTNFARRGVEYLLPPLGQGLVRPHRRRRLAFHALAFHSPCANREALLKMCHQKTQEAESTEGVVKREA